MTGFKKPWFNLPIPQLPPCPHSLSSLTCCLLSLTPHSCLYLCNLAHVAFTPHCPPSSQGHYRTSHCQILLSDWAVLTLLTPSSFWKPSLSLAPTLSSPSFLLIPLARPFSLGFLSLVQSLSFSVQSCWAISSTLFAFTDPQMLMTPRVQTAFLALSVSHCLLHSSRWTSQ